MSRSLFPILVVSLSCMLANLVCSASERSLRNDENSMVVVGMLGGSESVLMDLKLNSQLDRNLILAATYRVLFDLENSSRYAKLCFDTESTGHTEKSIVTATLCGLIDAGNHLLANDMAGWIHRKFELQNWAYPRLRKLWDDPALHLLEMSESNLEVTKEWPKVAVQRGPMAYSHIPIEWRKNFKDSAESSPYISVEINGKPVSMLLDSGTSTTIMNDAAATALGVTSMTKVVSTVVDQQNRKSTAVGGVIDKASIGSTTIRNLPVKIEETPFSVLGLDWLIELGTIEIRRDSLDVLNPDAAKATECKSPLHIGSNANGFAASLIMPINVQGLSNSALVDTGDTTYITGIRHDISITSPGLKSRSKRTLIGSSSEKYYDMQASIGFDSFEKVVKFPIMIDDLLRYATPYIVGSPILNDGTIFVDFVNRKACFLSIIKR